MLKMFITVCLILVIIFSYASNSSAEYVERIVTTGTGENFNSAYKNALRSAVEIVLGYNLVSETKIINSELISDEILQYSKGFVKSSSVLSITSEKGLVTVKVEALVFPLKLERKIIESGIVYPLNIFAEALTKQDILLNSKKLLDKVISKYPQYAYDLKLEKFKIKSIDSEKGIANISASLQVSFNDQFITELKDTLQIICYQQFENVDIKRWGHDLDSSNKKLNSNTVVFLFSDINSTGYAKKSYSIIADKSNDTSLLQNDRKVMINLIFLDNKNYIVTSIDTDIYDYSKLDNFLNAGNKPLLLKATYGKLTNGMTDLLFLTDSTVNFNIEFSIPIDTLATVSRIKPNLKFN